MTIAHSLDDPQLDGVPQPTIAQVIDRLTAITPGQVPRAVIAELVSQCRADLQPIHDDALPEMLERLARHRLTYYLRDSSAWRS
jgi:hypothetical protein